MIIEIFHIVVHNLSLDWKVDQKIVMYAHLSILKYVYITVLSVFHSTCQETVLHWICGTELVLHITSTHICAHNT